MTIFVRSRKWSFLEVVQNVKSTILCLRDMLGKRGIKPEELPAAEDIKKIERRVSGDEKKIEKGTNKLPKTKE
jgi:DNA-damage-inducible protein D